VDVTGIAPVTPGNKQSSAVSGLPSLQNLERRAPFQKIPEIITLVSRIALIVTSHGA